MQALIDFEGWRKWRGFMDSPSSSSPDVGSATSPMQKGHTEYTAPPDLDSPSAARPAKAKTFRTKRPNLPDADEILREDSWGSGGSGDTADIDSPVSPQTELVDPDIKSTAASGSVPLSEP